MDLPSKIDREQIAVFCQKYYLTRLALFGSLLTDRFGQDSDLDALFE